MKIQKILFLLGFSLTIEITKVFAQQTPNVIVIFADDLVYGDLGCLAHPNIKRFMF